MPSARLAAHPNGPEHLGGTAWLADYDNKHIRGPGDSGKPGKHTPKSSYQPTPVIRLAGQRDQATGCMDIVWVGDRLVAAGRTGWLSRPADDGHGATMAGRWPVS
jgi:hypothetical protein